MSYADVERSEPALLAALYSGGAGLIGLLAANFSLAHSAAVAVGMSASQALLTRPTVVAPKTIDKLVGPGDSSGAVAEVIGARAVAPRPDEPATAIGGLIFVAGFLVQLFAGVDMASAFISAAAIAGVQTAATHSRVYSPESGQAVAARSLIDDEEEEDDKKKKVPSPARHFEI